MTERRQYEIYPARRRPCGRVTVWGIVEVESQSFLADRFDTAEKAKAAAAWLNLSVVRDR